MIDLALFLGLPRATAQDTGKNSGRLVGFNATLQINAALLIDRLLGLRRPEDLVDAPASARRPHFIARELKDAKGRPWYELNLTALASDEAFLKVAA